MDGMIDMHAHLSCLTEGAPGDNASRIKALALEELELRKANGITTCFSTGTPGEWRCLEPFRTRKEILVSFGIHPWYCGDYTVEECREYLEACDFVGEIGMDSVWCAVPLDLQQRQLERQLQIAADLKKPVVLHTKGEEERIGDMIRGFPEKVCVHWYSGSEAGLETFLKRDCYFTLGPDTAALCRQNKSLNLRMVREIPADRLFVETDGISAVAWARGEAQADLREIPAVLRENLEYAATVKGCPAEALAEQMEANLQAFKKR